MTAARPVANDRAYRTIPDLFAAQAAARPDAPAVLSSAGVLTYGGLEARANQLSRLLRRRGVALDVPVGVFLERTSEMIVAVLAILKAGGAYMPLEPTYPVDRLAFMLNDARAALIISEESLIARLPNDRGPLLVLEALREEASGEPVAPLDARPRADDLAYLMYTSGSTGTPKGVTVPHRAIDRLVCDVDYARLGPEETLLHAAPLGFDASTFEIWGALLTGGRCALYPDPFPTGPGLRSVIARHQVTTAWLTAALFNAIIDEDPTCLRGLRQILTGGEALSVSHVRRALEALPHAQIINGYGPTETTTFAATYAVPRSLDPAALSVPIGRAIRDTRLYVLDDTQKPVPPGVIGELYIGGAGVARGYLRRPELTAERFLPGPAGAEDDRVYRTGDLVRELPDGNLDYLGRVDQQVKIRGFRIETGEIEATLGQHPAVRSTVVVAREDRPGDKRLVAHVTAARPGIPRRADQTQAPLSLMQQRLWFLEQYEPGRAVHVPSAHRLQGPLDVPALERAFQEMVKRQTALRTVVGEEDGTAVQVVLPQVQVNLVLEDFSALPRDEAEKAAAERMEGELILPFDLASGPLFRLRLFRIAHREHILFFVAHHIVFDGWSFDLLYEEISALYEAYTHGASPALAELPVTYGDFAAWHGEWVQGAEVERQLAYWMERLRGRTAPLDLPSDRPRPPVMTGGGDTIRIEIGETRTSALAGVAQKAGATLFMTLLAAFQAFLYRYTGQTDFNVGTPVRGRSWPEVERIVGFFVNALVLPARVDPGQSFLDLVGSVKQRTLEAFDHQDVPFERLIQDLNVPRDESRTPLYQVWFSFEDARSRPRGWGSLGHEDIPIFTPTTAQDLGLWFLNTSEKLVGALNYNTDLFDHATMVRFFDEFQEFLAAISETPEQSVGTLRVLPAEEVGRLRACNATDMPYPRDLGVHELVSAQAARTPDRPALEFEGRTLSYGELEAGSNRLARRLRAMGAQRGSLVGLAVERSPEMVTALLGILKAGAAYVPLDPSFPRERLSSMVADSGMTLLVTTATLQDDLALPVERVLFLDKDRSETLTQSAEPVPRDAHSAGPEDRAYVIYTSGSTGKPKGVEVPHRAVANFLTSMRERPGLTEADRLVAVTTLSFDIAVLELQLPLTVGATVVLASRETATDGERLRNLLRESQATVMQATPATWRLLLEAGWTGGPEFKVLVGGEALPREVAEELAKRAGSVWNMYGPTETTVWSTCWKVESPVVGSILIGTPIGNTQAHVLDPEMQPVPTGVPGELWIGGDGVSLGYLNKPDLTSERFVDDSFRRVPGAKLYRTGDLARWRADGNLEALGRTDFQVKVHGYRIELGEIESLLARHEGVTNAAVVARPGPGGENRLVAYVVGRDGKVPSPAELRKMLRRELPDYMIPSALVALDEFPLTPNGKIDRRALPDPEELRREPALASVPPRTSTEMFVADVWRELLGVSQVAVHDHFFDLGGHSLLIMRALAAMEKKIGKRLNPREYIFQNLEQIAQAYDRAPATSPDAPGLGRQILGSLSGALSRRRNGPA